MNSIFEINKALNEKEIAQKKTVLESKFQGLGVALTSRCCMQCIMCRVWEKNWEIPEETVEEIETYIPYLSRLYWQGGEVFLSKHFEKLFDRAAGYAYLKQEIVTNGILIDKKWAEKFAASNLNLIYSIDGMTKKTYEYIRKGAKFEDLLKSARLINQEKNICRNNFDASNNMTTCINFVVMKSNYKELEDTIDFAIEYGFDDLTLTPVGYITDEENIFLYKDIGILKHINYAVAGIQNKAAEYGIRFHNWLPFMNEKIEDKKLESNNVQNKNSSCYWPWQHLFIDVGGSVKPHCMCRQEAGNISANKLEEIWNNNIMQNYRKKILENFIEGFCNENCISNMAQADLFKIS